MTTQTVSKEMRAKALLGDKQAQAYLHLANLIGPDVLLFEEVMNDAHEWHTKGIEPYHNEGLGWDFWDTYAIYVGEPVRRPPLPPVEDSGYRCAC